MWMESCFVSLGPFQCAQIHFLWSPYVIEQTHYIFALWYAIFLSSFFSSPNLSGQRLDAYHTSTPGVVFVRIQNACLKCAAQAWLEEKKKKIQCPHVLRRAAITSNCTFLMLNSLLLVVKTKLVHIHNITDNKNQVCD